MPFVQVQTHDGAGKTLMDEELSLELYRKLFLVRVAEERIAELYPEQEMRCPVHLSIGQESASAAPCLALRKTDYAVSGHRAHGHYLGKGGNLAAMVAEIYGKETGCAGGKGGSMHLVDLDVGFLGSVPIVGSTIPIGVGAALGSQNKGEDRVTMIFFGDAAVETGVFHESLNFAVLKKLPIVFVCENNLYSVYSPMEVRQPDTRTIAALAAGHGVEAHRADGNCAETVYELARESVKIARSGGGPVFLELSTYRWREHCGPNYDNDIGYRTQEEFLEWRALDPVRRLKDKLLRESEGMEKKLRSLELEVEAEVDSAIRFAKDSAFPDQDRSATPIFAT